MARRTRVYLTAPLAASTVVLTLATACAQSTTPAQESASGGGSSTTGDTGSLSTTGNSGGTQGVDPEATSDGGSSQRQDFPDIVFEHDSSLDLPPETCAQVRVTAAPLPLDMYIVLDRTGSMRTGATSIDTSDCDVDVNSAPASTSKWCLAVNALGKYFTSASSRSNRAALQFMLPGAEVSGSQCASGTQNPHSQAAVGLTPLPEEVGASSGLVNALNDAVPDAGNTEIESALHGIANFTTAERSITRKMIGVLVTDGAAAGNCTEDNAVLATIASTHFTSQKIPTFIIGMTGAPYGPLEEMALGAGSPAHATFCDAADPNPSCHYWSVGDGDPSAFVAALGAIQETVVGCAFSVPTSDAGLVSLESISVDFKQTAQSAPLALTQVTDLSACTDNAFYTSEDAGSPIIKLCPPTCEQVGLESEVGVDFLCSGE